MNGSVMRKFGAGAVIFVIYVCLYLLTILPRGGFITLFGLTGFSLSQLLGATVLFAATLLLQTVTRYKYRKWYFLIVALLPFVPEAIMYIAGSAPYTAVPDTVFKVTAVIIAWYAGGFYGGGCGEINGKNASGAYGNINSVHASNNEAYRGFRMYVRAPWYITASFLWQSGFSTHLILTVSRGVESMDPERRVSRGRLRAKRRR
ncbi:MAG: hypothetical protein K1V87_05470 [Muribaculum sp.]